jgi:hypothetical protein
MEILSAMTNDVNRYSVTEKEHNYRIRPSNYLLVGVDKDKDAKP